MIAPEDDVDACPLAPDAAGEEFAEMQLRCLVCGAPARLEGR